MNRENKEKKILVSRESAILLFIILFGLAMMLLATFAPLEDFWQTIMFSVGIEFTASSTVFLINSALVENKAEKQHDDFDKRVNELAAEVRDMQTGLGEFSTTTLDTTSDINKNISTLRNDVEESFATKYSLMEIQNMCLMRRCTTKRVSEYITESSELDLQRDAAEFHILTNQMHHYDFTTISSLAIAKNITMGNEYVYYYPAECHQIFKSLCDQVEHFLLCDNEFGKKVAEWIRQYWSEKEKNATDNNSIIGRIKHFSSSWRTPEKFLNDFDESIRDDVRDAITTMLEGMELDEYGVVHEDISGWINPSGCKCVKPGKIIRCVRKIEEAMEKLKALGVNPNDYGRFSAFLEIVDLYYLSKQLENIEENRELDERLVAKYMSDKTPGAPVILQWIQNGACQDVKKTIEQNLIGIALGSARVVPCYNFCIVVPTSRNKSANNEVSIAWYTCHSDISEAGGTVDSYITVYANDKSHEDADLKNGLVRAYLGLIEDTGGARERLNEFGSRIFEFDPDKK